MSPVWRSWIVRILALLAVRVGGGAIVRGSMTARAQPAPSVAHADPQAGTATSTPALLLPASVAYDSAGNLFFADAKRNQVFELSISGAWSVVAGTGEQGFAGDGGPAASAALNAPRGLAVAGDKLYIADTGNQRVRMVLSGVISTVAGSGARGFSGDGPPLQAALRDPAALAVDASGALLVCDTGNQRVRRISGGSLVTIAGSGVQGDSGDGGPGTAAALDTPMGVAVAADGTILIADAHNHRVRSLRVDGTVADFAGSGTRGYAGDGALATQARLDTPLGVANGADGSVLIADAGNQRIRSVARDGVITTVAGSGVQGAAEDGVAGGAAALDTPRAVSAQLQGQPVFADSHNGLVRQLANDNALYTLALLAAPRTSVVSLSASSPAIYGLGTAVVTVTGTAIPVGTVAVTENGGAVGSVTLAGGEGSLSLAQLGVGSHSLAASYSGDGLNGGASGNAVPLVVTVAPAVATAKAAAAIYGAPLPSLDGTVTGILPQDAGSVHAVFSSAAAPFSPVGSYVIGAVLSGQGSANYSLSMSAASGSLIISPAGSATTLTSSTQSYAGLPMLLSAKVAPLTAGTPSGTVDFLDGAMVVGTGRLVNGSASASVLSATAGSHTLAARYGGDANFLASASSAASVVVSPMPDFDLSFTPASQSVQGGAVVTYLLTVSPANGAFTGAVSLDVSGLPPGATATFTPPVVIPGASAVGATLSVRTAARSGLSPEKRMLAGGVALSFTVFCWLPGRRRRWPVCLPAFLLLTALGCGTRTTAAAASEGQSYTMTIRGTGTNLAGTVVSHSAVATLTVL